MADGILAGNVCVLTGASRGIGRAAALAIARQGAKVVINSRDAAACEAVVAQITAAGGNAAAFAGDVTQREAMQALVAFAQQRFGHIDRAFLNAGNLFGAGPLVTTPPERLRASLDVNLVGPFHGLQALIPAIRDGGGPRGGAIVVTSAGAGLRGRAGLADYAASKWGVIGLCLSAALEAAKLGIRINVIAPGYIATESWMTMLGARAEQLAAAVPLGRLGQPEDVGDVVTWLLSDASRYVTGAVLPIDGGLTIA